MAYKSIQTNAHQFDGNKILNYSMMLGGMQATRDVLEQYDPLVTGYGRLFMVRPPKQMLNLMSDKTKYFKHMLEYANTQVQGLNDVTLESQQVTGGYAGRSFEIPTVAKDETNSFTVTVFELSGSPIREYLHTWINTISDIQTGLSHYGGLIASGKLGYSQANHTAEFIYVVTDRTGMKVEYACLFANCFPKGYKNDQFNYQAGEHQFVETAIEFSCVKYEGADVNAKAKILLDNYQILVNSIEFNTGLTDIIKSDGIHLNDEGNTVWGPTGYDGKTGELKDKEGIHYFNVVDKSAKFNESTDYMTPSWSQAGNEYENNTDTGSNVTTSTTTQ